MKFNSNGDSNYNYPENNLETNFKIKYNPNEQETMVKNIDSQEQSLTKYNINKFLKESKNSNVDLKPMDHNYISQFNNAPENLNLYSNNNQKYVLVP